MMETQTGKPQKAEEEGKKETRKRRGEKKVVKF